MYALPQHQELAEHNCFFTINTNVKISTKKKGTQSENEELNPKMKMVRTHSVYIFRPYNIKFNEYGQTTYNFRSGTYSRPLYKLMWKKKSLGARCSCVYFQMLKIQILMPLLFRTDFLGYRGLQYVHNFLVS